MTKSKLIIWQLEGLALATLDLSFVEGHLVSFSTSPDLQQVCVCTSTHGAYMIQLDRFTLGKQDWEHKIEKFHEIQTLPLSQQSLSSNDELTLFPDSFPYTQATWMRGETNRSEARPLNPDGDDGSRKDVAPCASTSISRMASQENVQPGIMKMKYPRLAHEFLPADSQTNGPYTDSVLFYPTRILHMTSRLSQTHLFVDLSMRSSKGACHAVAVCSRDAYEFKVYQTHGSWISLIISYLF